MWQKRRLLYHRGVDDHAGTYVTDYVFAGVCFVLCVHLIIRIRRERKQLSQEQRMASSCRHIQNWLPWNWPKENPTPVTMSTIGVFLVAIGNIMMAFLGGLTHQFLQTVEPYNDVSDLYEWLIVWRIAASFSAFLCLGLLIMTEQLLIQEGVIRVPRTIRTAYYVIIILACVVFFGYNFVPLAGNTEDPFSIKQSFVVTFAVMFIYGFTTIVVVTHHYCCRNEEANSYSSDDVPYSPVHSVESKRSERRPYKKEVYSRCKNIFVHCHGNTDDVTSRRGEFILTVSSPWIYIAAGVINYFLKSKCADAEDAYTELGCPLPNSFNHNSLMHFIQIFSLIGFFWAENLSMTRRRSMEHAKIRRITTSSTIYNDVINAVGSVDTKSTVVIEKNEFADNNNKPSGRDDVICEVKSDIITQRNNDVTFTSTIGDDVIAEPKFPTELVCESEKTANRLSVYDNMAVTTVISEGEINPWELRPNPTSEAPVDE